MSKLQIASAGLVLAICAVAVFFFVSTKRANGSKSTQQPAQSTGDPCVFKMSPETIDASPQLSAAFKARSERELRGYPQDTPVAEALKIFNAEMRCYSFWASLPPLSEEEVIANMVAGADYTGGGPSQEVFRGIAKTRVLPKGSLLVAEPGGCDSELAKSQICVKGLKIYLFFDLDKKPRGPEVLDSKQVVLLRKTYFGTEPVE